MQGTLNQLLFNHLVNDVQSKRGNKIQYIYYNLTIRYTHRFCGPLIRDFVVLTSEKTPSSRGFCRVLEKPRSSPDHFCPSCCGVTIGSEQQHNQDFRKIYKGRRILEFITFYHNALHLTRVHCATNNSNKNTGKRVHRSLPRLRVFFVANFLQHG